MPLMHKNKREWGSNCCLRNEKRDCEKGERALLTDAAVTRYIMEFSCSISFERKSNADATAHDFTSVSDSDGQGNFNLQYFPEMMKEA